MPIKIEEIFDVCCAKLGHLRKQDVQCLVNMSLELDLTKCIYQKNTYQDQFLMQSQLKLQVNLISLSIYSNNLVQSNKVGPLLLSFVKAKYFVTVLCWKCSNIVPAREYISALSFVLLACILALILFSCISCLIYSASYVFRISCIPRLISFTSNVDRYIICFMSCLRSCLNLQATQAVSQHSDRVSSQFWLQSTSRNQL